MLGEEFADIVLTLDSGCQQLLDDYVLDSVSDSIRSTYISQLRQYFENFAAVTSLAARTKSMN